MPTHRHNILSAFVYIIYYVYVPNAVKKEEEEEEEGGGGGGGILSAAQTSRV